jgi:hypothetical protein
VGGYFYMRNRKKGLAEAEAEANVIRYNATELSGIQVDFKVGDIVEIASSGTPNQPNWALSILDYPQEQIDLTGPDENGSWLWSVRGVSASNEPTVYAAVLETQGGGADQPPEQRQFTLKVHPAS